jgi:NAD+ kinase
VGFLSENRPEDVAQALISGNYTIESRAMLRAVVSPEVPSVSMWDYALNEITVHRSGAAMLGVDVDINGVKLPTYWADGLVVSTSSGSTAYSLSVGGPIVLPESKVLLISPIAPHNLNIRPLVVPDSSVVRLRMHSRDGRFSLTADNRTVEVDENVEIEITVAQFSLKRVRLNHSNFINALTEKLFWGEDVRNIR